MTGTMIVGIDCSTTGKLTGLALGQYDGRQLQILETRCGDTALPRKIVADWLSNGQRALIALDTPLGWPKDLGPALIRHRAGEPIGLEADTIFRRETDRVIRDRECHPFDVGADKIARTAHAYLRLLADLREGLRLAIPLAWSPSYRSRVAAIEVYPAVTLARYGLPKSGYKDATAKHRDVRMKIIRGLRKKTIWKVSSSSAAANADALDAVVCVLTGRDFLAGNCVSPTNRTLAEKEGWIWVPKSRA